MHPPSGTEPEGFRTLCEFHMENSGYILMKRNVLWTANSGEYCYVFEVPHLTADRYRELESFVYETGMSRIDSSKPGHMATNLTLIVVCDTCDRDAKRLLCRCRIHKNFRLGLNGWMDFHTALACVSDGSTASNMGGHDLPPLFRKLFAASAGMEPA